MRLAEWLDVQLTGYGSRSVLRQANRAFRDGRVTEAASLYGQVLQSAPRNYRAHYGLGLLRHGEGRHGEALGLLDAALEIRPNSAPAWSNRGNVLQALHRPEEALASYDKALSFRPRYADAHVNRANALIELKRPGEALASCKRAIALEPDRPAYRNIGSSAALLSCNFLESEYFAAELAEQLSNGNLAANPFHCHAYADDPSLHAQCARLFIKDIFSGSTERLPSRPLHARDKIRLAYLSADFHDHATAYLMTELIELHHRDRFEVVGISVGPNYAGPMRARLDRAFDRLVDVSGMNDWEAAKFIWSQQIDIAIDLKGFTADGRPQIFAHRPAPIQVSYLGYPGTIGADFIDYVLADAVVLPFDQQPFYVEKIVHLPNCYQVNDRKREIAEETPSREACRLPPEGFVFCCFNSSYKIRAAVFDVWMRLLQAVPGSALWLMHDNDDDEKNLRQEAKRRGVDPARLVFAERLPLEQHLARHRLADLFLDTLPVTAHTTASDALWAGLPVLTCRGRAFAARVAASLLNAVGLPELVTTSLEDYEALALRLASNPSLLAELRGRLQRNRSTCSLFDTPRFCRHIEAAYATMWERHQRGQPPEAFAVTEAPKA